MLNETARTVRGRERLGAGFGGTEGRAAGERGVERCGAGCEGTRRELSETVQGVRGWA